MKKWNPMTKKISYRQLNVCNSRLWKIHFLKDDENEDQENPSRCLQMHKRQTDR